MSTTFSQYFEKCPTVTVLCCRVLRTGAQPLPALLQLRAGQRARGLAGGVLGAVPRGRLLQHLQLHGGHRHQQPQLPAVRAAQGRALRVGGPGVRTQLGGLQVHYHVTLCNVMSHHVTLCHAVQPRPWPGLQLLQRGRAGAAASSAAVPPRGEAGRGVLHVRGQVRHKYLHIYISTYLQLRGRDTRTAADLQHCSSLCHQAPYCRSFTYKWVAALHSDRLTPAPPQDQLLPGHQQLLPVGAGGGGGAAAGPAAGLGVDAVRGAGRPRLRTRRRRRGQVARTLQLPPSPQYDYHITNLVH